MMASLATACRLSTRLLGRKAVSESAKRSFGSSTRWLAAQNFTMPALSPTMTEGNIAAWKVKEGDTYVAGDVLLEIETDKATMDVEAQEEGVVMKIMAGDGTKAVQVGTRIAVMAEEGDDISKLEMPPDEKSATPPTKEDKSEKSPAKPNEEPGAPKKEARKTPHPSGEKHKQMYPLTPSVHSLVKEHGLDDAAVESIKPTGPNGRLLKGDVLAYLGSIKAETPAKVSARFEALSHLDLSNIKVAPRKEAPKKAKGDLDATRAVPEKAKLAVPISLSKAIEVQKKMQDNLGTFMPLSTFIARATEVANDELPAVPRAPTADELFNAVLGLNSVPAPASRGAYVPQISALASPPSFPQAIRKPDILDILTAPPKKAAPTAPSFLPGISTGTNMFSLVVPMAEERRASVFLDRMKVILEKDPGRLVL